MTDLTEQEVCIGSVMQQNVYLNWSDVKDICTNEVLEAYERTKRENAQLKDLLKEVKDYLPEFEIPMGILAKIDEALK